MIELNKIYCEDCLDTMKRMDDNSVDAIVTDPPYELGFMGKKWDNSRIAYNIKMWKECLRVLKPGGHLLAFGGTRTSHRMVCAIEDAGFEIRDSILWLYGSGFPKSMNIGKVVDKLNGEERQKVGIGHGTSYVHQNKVNVEQGFRPNDYYENNEGKFEVTKGTSEWEGWGTALKPAVEPICLARKPLSEKTIALNVLKWGTGGLNIDWCRVEGIPPSVPQPKLGVKKAEIYNFATGKGRNGEMSQAIGRFPANVIHDGSEEVVSQFPYSISGSMDSVSKGKNYGIYGKYNGKRVTAVKSEGSVSRFFYCAKASKSERNFGLNGFNEKRTDKGKYRPNDDGTKGIQSRLHGATTKDQNNHPTVKPISLMRYLCRLITPPKGIIYDPFIGSGTTAIAAGLEGFNFIGSEISEEYCKIAEARINHYLAQQRLTL